MVTVKYIPQCTASAAEYVYYGMGTAAKDIP
jgi:hypothetical protein